MRKLVLLSLFSLAVTGFALGNASLYDKATDVGAESALSSSLLAIDVGPGPSVIAWDRS